MPQSDFLLCNRRHLRNVNRIPISTISKHVQLSSGLSSFVYFDLFLNIIRDLLETAEIFF